MGAAAAVVATVVAKVVGTTTTDVAAATVVAKVVGTTTTVVVATMVVVMVVVRGRPPRPPSCSSESPRDPFLPSRAMRSWRLALGVLLPRGRRLFLRRAMLGCRSVSAR